ncbi:MAG TPA: hypothetical protein VD884_00330 [Ohtaekwangia sp.]|nr:hypothetical protein [Ohtaekwangia sp.]
MKQHKLLLGYRKFNNDFFFEGVILQIFIPRLLFFFETATLSTYSKIPVSQRVLEIWKRYSLYPRCEKGTMQLMETIRPYYNYRIIPGLHSVEEQQTKDRFR